VQAVVPVGPYQDVAIVPSPSDTSPYLEFERFVRVGVRTTTFQNILMSDGPTAIGQYYGLVQQGLVFTDLVHLFRGLERPLDGGDNETGDRDILVFSWVPKWDWQWDLVTQKPVRLAPPRNRVFVIQVKPFTVADEHGVVGIVLHWNWVAEDRVLPGAPVNYGTRYAVKVWTKFKT